MQAGQVVGSSPGVVREHGRSDVSAGALGSGPKGNTELGG